MFCHRLRKSLEHVKIRIKFSKLPILGFEKARIEFADPSFGTEESNRTHCIFFPLVLYRVALFELLFGTLKK